MDLSAMIENDFENHQWGVRVSQFFCGKIATAGKKDAII